MPCCVALTAEGYVLLCLLESYDHHCTTPLLSASDWLQRRSEATRADLNEIGIQRIVDELNGRGRLDSQSFEEENARSY